MKRSPIITVLLMMFLMITSVVPAFAGAPTEYDIPEVGTEIHGFVVTNVSYMETKATDVVELTHTKTGSVLFWLANDSINRSYMMAFHTPVYDDTGVAHVFEHATLGGSTKYPGANTFFELGSKTSYTYLNAATGICYTLYPMASASEDQLFQYMDYYMNGLTDPLAISNPYAMMREAYRYELNSPEDEISLQGVVYSEMLGALTQSRMANYNASKMLWPDSSVSSISGGDPSFIPELTIEKLRDFHETYYHPSNATMYLTGDIDLPRFLQKLDTDFLSHYDKRDIAIDDPNYKPLQPGFYEQVFEYPVSNGTPSENATLIHYQMPYQTDSYNDLMTLDYVCAYLNDESSPFKRLMLERLPGASVSVTTVWNAGGKYQLDFFGSGLNEVDKTVFKDTCDEALANLLQEGVNEAVLQAIRINRQFNNLMQLDSSSVYLDTTMSMAVNWTLFDDRYFWQQSDYFESHTDDFITVEKLNETARRCWSDLDTAILAVTVPVPGLKEEQEAALRKQLDDMKAAMTPEEIDELVEQTQAYNAFVEESNQITMPASLNALTVSTLPEEVPYTPASETSIGGIRVITSEMNTPLIRVSIMAKAGTIPFEDLFDFMEYLSLIGTMSTDLYTREELPAAVSSVSTGMYILSPVIYEDSETRMYTSLLQTAWYALPETLEDSFKLVEDILYHTDFSDYDYIRSDAAQRFSGAMQSVNTGSLSYALSEALSVFSAAQKISYYQSSAAFLQYLNKVSKMTDAELDTLVSKFDGFRDLVLNRNIQFMTILGNHENTLKATALAYNMVSRFDETVLETIPYESMIDDSPLHTAVVTGGNVAFNIAVTDLEAAGYEQLDGGLLVLANVMNDKLLYPELRVKNSAYGGYTLFSDYLFGFYSYRDPEIAKTYQVYETAGDFLRNLQISEEELAGYIISSYGSVTNPVGPLSMALQGISDKAWGKNNQEDTLKMIRDLKKFTPGDLAGYAGLMDALGSSQAVRATSASETMIADCQELFDVVDYSLINAGVVSE